MKKALICLFAGMILLAGCCSYRVVKTTAAHIPVDKRADAIKDKQLETTLRPFAEKAVAVSDEVIGYADEDLTPGHPESLLGNFFADVMLAYGRKHSTGNVDLAVTNPGGLRKPIHKGNIKTGNIYELMPFENALVILDLTGDHVQALADSIAAHDGGPVAGIRFGIKNGKAVGVTVQGQSLDPSRVYRVVANDYIAKGNDFYYELTRATATETFTESLRTVILDWVKQQTAKGQKIHSVIDGRVYEEK
jgi:2',3'-cyclic-nucleotide 2'-phosphodiesterase (5'-nucleotidase family)